MQAVEQKKTVTISPEVHNRIISLRRGNQTYGDVVAEAINLKIRLDSLIPKTFKCLNSIGIYPLRKPMNFDVSFDSQDVIWDIRNKELSILGCGNTYDEIISSLEDEIDCYVAAYMLSNHKLSKESIELKKQLDEYIDFNKALEIYSDKYGDAVDDEQA
ncbi:MAG: hypothetical protein Q4Q53_09000 [Methanocorpusculum sp.]|nr:hypothetical protein [Methanocorpusculum sp.]